MFKPTLLIASLLLISHTAYAEIQTWTASGTCLNSSFQVGNTGYDCSEAFSLLEVPTIEVAFSLTFDTSYAVNDPAAFIDLTVTVDPNEVFGSSAIYQLDGPLIDARFDPASADVLVMSGGWTAFSAGSLFWDLTLDENTHFGGEVTPFASPSNLWTLTPVPVPAAAWLFGSALVGLAAIKRKK